MAQLQRRLGSLRHVGQHRLDHRPPADLLPPRQGIGESFRGGEPALACGGHPALGVTWMRCGVHEVEDRFFQPRPWRTLRRVPGERQTPRVVHPHAVDLAAHVPLARSRHVHRRAWIVTQAVEKRRRAMAGDGAVPGAQDRRPHARFERQRPGERGIDAEVDPAPAPGLDAPLHLPVRQAARVCLGTADHTGLAGEELLEVHPSQPARAGHAAPDPICPLWTTVIIGV
nr:hypothetical protein [Jiangella aurantiaca]